MLRLTYPDAPTADHVDDYHGHRVADPYRPLEDGDAPATRAWIAAQNELTEGVLAGAPARDEILEAGVPSWNHRSPRRHGPHPGGSSTVAQAGHGSRPARARRRAPLR